MIGLSQVIVPASQQKAWPVHWHLQPSLLLAKRKKGAWTKSLDENCTVQDLAEAKRKPNRLFSRRLHSSGKYPKKCICTCRCTNCRGWKFLLLQRAKNLEDLLVGAQAGIRCYHQPSLVTRSFQTKRRKIAGTAWKNWISLHSLRRNTSVRCFLCHLVKRLRPRVELSHRKRALNLVRCKLGLFRAVTGMAWQLSG